MLQVVDNGSATNRPATILFVDDEPRVLTSMRALFRKGYTVLTANSGAEALAILESRTVDLVISDQRMPEMTGVELLAKVRTEYPATERILLTGYADLSAIEAALNEAEVSRYLVKPCPPGELRAAAAAVLGQEPTLPAAANEAQLLADVVVLNPENRAATPAAEPAAMKASEAQEVAAEPSVSSTETPVQKAVQETAEKAAEETANGKTAPADANDPAPQRPGPAASSGANAGAAAVLVLTEDPSLAEELKAVVATLPGSPIEELNTQPKRRAKGAPCLVATSVDQARMQLASGDVAVVITDLANDSASLDAIRTTLAGPWPTPHFVVAADRADASRLINLINGGAIYRFLLKPVAAGQCRLWLHSARRSFVEQDPDRQAAAAAQSTDTPTSPSALPFGTRAANEAWWTRLLARLLGRWS
ncbi:MAG: response regulator [Pseudomonadota bacterium]